MHEADLPLLRDPLTGGRLAMAAGGEREHGELKSGVLQGEHAQYPIRAFVPRFVSDEGYAASFGRQWTRYRRTQLDRFNNTRISRDRLFRDTEWTAGDLAEARLLEIGCGAGRYTQVLLDAGARVVSVDRSSAVDACWANNGPHLRLTVLQADLHSLPLPAASFDYVLCFGVLQHTPDPELAFRSIVQYLRPGGRIAADVYKRRPWITRWTAKYWYRGITKRLPSPLLFRLVEWYVPRWLSWDNRCQRVRVLRHAIPALIPCCNYTGLLPLSSEQIVEWAILDTFDGLASRYDRPQTLSTFRRWFDGAGLQEVSVREGGNGLVGTARAPNREG